MQPMTALETMSFFYVVFATGFFTAGLLGLASYAAILGIKTTWKQIQIGRECEAAVEQAETARRMSQR